MRKIIVVLLCLFFVGCDTGFNEDITYSQAENENEQTENNTIVGEAVANNPTPAEDTVDEEAVVIIKDAVLEALIREQLGKPEGSLLQSDLNEIEDLNINYEETPVYELDGLEYAVNLRSFSFRNGQLRSLNPLQSSQFMYKLNISYSEIEEPIVLFDTPMLEAVSIIDSDLNNYDFIRQSFGLETLTITKGQLDTLDILANLSNIKSVHIEGCGLLSIDALMGKVQLESLNLQKNNITDISVLNTCIKLFDLNLSYNNVTNIEPILDLENLFQFTVYEELDKKLIDRTHLEQLIDRGIAVKYHE